MIEILDLGRSDHHQVRELVDHAEDVRQGRLALLAPRLVELGQVPRRVSPMTW